jgi:hypothetical protein
VADRVTFTKAAAERIAQTVRIVEAGNRDTAGLPTAPRFGGGVAGAPVKFCSWTASWAHDTTTTISLYPSGTATARNLYFGVVPGDGLVAKKGTSGWQLISCDLTLQAGYGVTGIQLLGHDENEFAHWYHITTCSTATASP